MLFKKSGNVSALFTFFFALANSRSRPINGWSERNSSQEVEA